MSLVLHHAHVACFSISFVRFVVVVVIYLQLLNWNPVQSLSMCTMYTLYLLWKCRALHADMHRTIAVVSVIDVERTTVCQIRRFFALTSLFESKGPLPLPQHKQHVFFCVCV